MLRACSNNNPDLHILTTRRLKQYLRAEFSVLKQFLTLVVQLKLEQGHGSHFAQVIHNGVTLANHKKYEAIRLQMVDPKWICNHVICLGFVRSAVNTDTSVARLLDDTCFDRTNQPLNTVAGLMVSDCAAIGVSTESGMSEKEGCDMHDGDKVGLSATGTLTRSKNKIIVNPFPAGLALLALARKVATHFSYGSRLGILHDLGKGCDAPKIKPKIDLNGTRVAAHQQLLFSLLRLN